VSIIQTTDDLTVNNFNGTNLSDNLILKDKTQEGQILGNTQNNIQDNIQENTQENTQDNNVASKKEKGVSQLFRQSVLAEHNYQDIAKSQLKFCSLNVCGLRSKLLSYDFENFIKSYDIVCLTETKLSDHDDLEFDGYTIFMKNRKNVRRNSGGVAVIIRNDLCKHVKIIETDSEFTLWFKISSKVAGYELLCCNVYIPPENSSYSDINMFNTIEEEFVSVHNEEVVCFFGDFNARTKDLTDLISLDSKVLNSMEMVDDYIRSKIEEENTLDEMGFQLNRVSQDVKSNNYGLRLLEMCKTLGICIMNGRVGSDNGIGQTTCDDTSVVDYIISTLKIFPFIADFKVMDFDCNFSDKHCPLYLGLKVVDSSFFKVNTDTTDNIRSNDLSNGGSSKPKWSNEKAEEFKANLSDEKVSQLYDILQVVDGDGMNQHNIDEIVNSIGSIFNDCAAETGIMIKPRLNERKRHTDCKPWYNTECEMMRKRYFHVKNQFAVTKTLLLRQGMRHLNKEYKKTLRKAYNEYYKELNTKLRGLRYTKPKVYWAMLNKGSKKREDIPIKTDEFYNHFRDLNNANVDEAVESDIVEHGGIEFNVELNAPFTTGEINKCIIKLKNNKAYGTDLILNEYLKSSSSKMLPIYEKLFNLVLNTGFVPNAWLSGIIKPLYKNKGDKNDVNNYRGITILSCFGKLFTSVLNNRLSNFLDSQNAIGPEQAGFRKGYSTLDHIFTMRYLIDLYLGKKKRLGQI
jgi:exonuclease III